MPAPTLALLTSDDDWRLLRTAWGVAAVDWLCASTPTQLLAAASEHEVDGVVVSAELLPHPVAYGVLAALAKGLPDIQRSMLCDAPRDRWLRPTASQGEAAIDVIVVRDTLRGPYAGSVDWQAVLTTPAMRERPYRRLH